MQESTIVTTYENPDLDGYACTVAYAEYLQAKGHLAQAAIYGRPHDEVGYMLERYKIQPVENPTGKIGSVALVDSSDLLSLPPHLEPAQVVEIIDHRQVNQSEFFPNAKAQIELVGAAATLVAEHFHKDSIVPSPATALLLYGAIASNTLAFSPALSITTDRDRKMAAWLSKTIDIDPQFEHDLFMAKSNLEGEVLYARIGSDFARFQFGTTSIGIAQIEMIGATELVEKRSEEILSVVHELKKEYDLDHSFISLLDVKKEVNLFLSSNPKTRELVGKALGLPFTDPVIIRPGLLLRKEIAPLLRKVIESP